MYVCVCLCVCARPHLGYKFNIYLCVPSGCSLDQRTMGAVTDCRAGETRRHKTTSTPLPPFTSLSQTSSTMTSPPSTTTSSISTKMQKATSSTFHLTTPRKPFIPCDWQVEKIPLPTRLQAVLVCNQTSADIFVREVRSDTTPLTTLSTAHDVSCLRRVIHTRCSDVNLRVPRLAHYVWFGPRKMSLHFFVSVLSVVRFLRPCLLLFHGDRVPAGPYWPALLQLVPYVVHVPRPRPRRIFGNVINVVEHSADVARLQLLIGEISECDFAAKPWGGSFRSIHLHFFSPKPLLSFSCLSRG